MKTLILSGFGTNCERETRYACSKAGGEQVETHHINAIFAGGIDLGAFQFLILIGGFLDGDDLGSGRACANRFRYRTLPGGGVFLERLLDFVEGGNLVLGICNGFQVLVKLGLLPGGIEPGSPQQVTLAPNANGRFEDRWVTLAADPASPCVFTRGLATIDLPVRHGEGRLVAETPALLQRLVAGGQAPLRYAHPFSAPTETYPHNPNGSPLGVAALCNTTGTVMGLMPHPEAYNHFTNHPRWSRHPERQQEGEGLAIFRNAYRHLREQRA